MRILDQTQVESSWGEDISSALLSCLYIQICRRDALLYDCIKIPRPIDDFMFVHRERNYYLDEMHLIDYHFLSIENIFKNI